MDALKLFARIALSIDDTNLFKSGAPFSQCDAFHAWGDAR